MLAITWAGVDLERDLDIFIRQGLEALEEYLARRLAFYHYLEIEHEALDS